MFPRNNLFPLPGLVLTFMVLIPAVQAEEQEDYRILREIILNEFQKEVPADQGTDLNGVLRRFETSEKKVAIVLGACLDQGADLDDSLFRKLEENKIPASLFLDHGWLHKNSAKIKDLLSSGLIRLENHGMFCRPLSIAGKGPQNHPGTSDVDEVFEEIEKNARNIETVSGRLPRFFKSGYEFYDDVSLKIVSVLGYIAIGGDLKLRASDVATDDSLKVFLEQVQSGSMIVIPANRPGTAAVWLPKLLQGLSFMGYQVVALDEVMDTAVENS